MSHREIRRDMYFTSRSQVRCLAASHAQRVLSDLLSVAAMVHGQFIVRYHCEWELVSQFIP